MDNRILEIADEMNLSYIKSDIDGIIVNYGFTECDAFMKDKYRYLAKDCSIVAKKLFGSDWNILTAVVLYNIYLENECNLKCDLEKTISMIEDCEMVVNKKSTDEFSKKYFQEIAHELRKYNFSGLKKLEEYKPKIEKWA